MFKVNSKDSRNFLINKMSFFNEQPIKNTFIERKILTND